MEAILGQGVRIKGVANAEALKRAAVEKPKRL
jgi:hypothetical protein